MINESIYSTNEINKKIKFILLMYKESLTTIKSIFELKATLFEESVVNEDNIRHLKKTLALIPKQFDVLYGLLENDKSSEAENQKNFMVSELTDIINQCESIEATVGSHKNDTTLTASAFASLQKLKNLAKEHKENLENL